MCGTTQPSSGCVQRGLDSNRPKLPNSRPERPPNARVTESTRGSAAKKMRVRSAVALLCALAPAVSGFALAPRLHAAPAANRHSHGVCVTHPTWPSARPSTSLRCAVETSTSRMKGDECDRKTLLPAQARQMLEQLVKDDKWEKNAVVEVLNAMQGEKGTGAMFNSSAILFRRTV